MRMKLVTCQRCSALIDAVMRVGNGCSGPSTCVLAAPLMVPAPRCQRIAAVPTCLMLAARAQSTVSREWGAHLRAIVLTPDHRLILHNTAFGRPPLPMPLYSMFCMAKPAIGRAAVGSMMRLAGTTVLNKGGVLTDIVSFGKQDLAYDIRNQGVKYSQVRALSHLRFADPHPAGCCVDRSEARRLKSAVTVLQAEIFQMDFMVDPAALEDLEHDLKVDERMLRYVLQKKDPLPRLPTTYKVSKLARALRERQLLPVC